MSSSNIVQKLWNYCNVLRDAGRMLHSAANRTQTVVPLLWEFADPPASAPRSHPRTGQQAVKKGQHHFSQFMN